MMADRERKARPGPTANKARRGAPENKTADTTAEPTDRAGETPTPVAPAVPEADDTKQQDAPARGGFGFAAPAEPKEG